MGRSENPFSVVRIISRKTTTNSLRQLAGFRLKRRFTDRGRIAITISPQPPPLPPVPLGGSAKGKQTKFYQHINITSNILVLVSLLTTVRHRSPFTTESVALGVMLRGFRSCTSSIAIQGNYTFSS